MKIIKKISWLILFLILIGVLFHSKERLISVYFNLKYTKQIELVKEVVQSIISGNEDYKEYFTKNSYFLSRPVYYKQAKVLFKEINAETFSPVFVHLKVVDGFEITYITMKSENGDRFNFNLKNVNGKLKVDFIHGNP